MKIKCFLTLLLVSLSPILSHAQTEYNFDRLFQDSEKIITKPFHWDSEDLITLGSLVAVTAGAVLVDKDIKTWVNENDTYKNSFAFEFGRLYGQGYTGAIICGGTFIGGLVFNNKKLKKIGFEMFETLLFAGAVTTAFKYGFGRERPTLTNDPYNFNPFSFKGFDFRSFNSGHAAVAFSVSTVLAANTSNNYLKALFFLPAVLTAASRVYQNYHWTSDVIAGSAIGYFIGSFITSLHSENKGTSVVVSTDKIYIIYRF